MNASYCPKCGWHFATHNGDGSCVEDEIQSNRLVIALDTLQDALSTEYEYDRNPSPTLEMFGDFLSQKLQFCLTMLTGDQIREFRLRSCEVQAEVRRSVR